MDEKEYKIKSASLDKQTFDQIINTKKVDYTPCDSENEWILLYYFPCYKVPESYMGYQSFHRKTG